MIGCGGELYQREDDQPATVTERLRVYAEQTAPLIDYYERRGLLRRIEANGTIDQVDALIEKALAGSRVVTERRIILKSETELAKMRRAGRIVAQVLAALAEMARPGLTTAALDARAAELTATAGRDAIL